MGLFFFIFRFVVALTLLMQALSNGNTMESMPILTGAINRAYPFVFRTNSTLYCGLSIELLDEIAKILNFQYKLYQPSLWIIKYGDLDEAIINGVS